MIAHSLENLVMRDMTAANNSNNNEQSQQSERTDTHSRTIVDKRNEMFAVRAAMTQFANRKWNCNRVCVCVAGVWTI